MDGWSLDLDPDLVAAVHLRTLLDVLGVQRLEGDAAIPSLIEVGAGDDVPLDTEVPANFRVPHLEAHRHELSLLGEEVASLLLAVANQDRVAHDEGAGVPQFEGAVVDDDGLGCIHGVSLWLVGWMVGQTATPHGRPFFSAHTGPYPTSTLRSSVSSREQ